MVTVPGTRTDHRRARGGAYASQRIRPTRSTESRHRKVRTFERPGATGKLTASGPKWHAGDVRRLTLLLERVLPVGILVVAVVGAPVMIFSPEGLPRLRGLERELAQVEEESADLRREIDALRGRVERLRDDPTAVERIARDNLGMVRQTEVVFQFPTRR